MELTPAKNHADSFESVIERLQDGIDSKGAPETIELLRFLKNEVIAPSQWFVMSLSVLVLIVGNETYFGRAKDIRLVAWAREGKYHFSKHFPGDTDGTVSFDNKTDAKQFLEDFFAKPSELI